MKKDLNSFLENKMNEHEQEQLDSIVPKFIIDNDEIFKELKTLDRQDNLEIFNGLFISVNNLGEKLFINSTNLTSLDEFKKKIVNYNPKAELPLNKINDLILSDIASISEQQFKEHGIQPFFNDSYELKVRKIKNSFI